MFGSDTDWAYLPLIKNTNWNQFSAEGNTTMSRANWIRFVLIVVLGLIVLLVIRLHVAAGQGSMQDLVNAAIKVANSSGK